ncbi:MAG: class I SAM-dependent methyltransferase [Kiloniellaceae bacterium]
MAGDEKGAARRRVGTVSCPVCRGPAAEHFLRVEARDYWRCSDCQARFLDPGQLPQREDELSHYLQHDNDPDDPGYRGFLAKLADPLLERLGPGRCGLDYGCGPGPALATMLREAGHSVALYDPFFHPDPAPLQRTYDFIACSETAEHFHDPAREFDCLDCLLRPGGWLAVMTCFQRDDARFADWHYRRDPTHVVFYREATFRRIAAQREWACEIPVKDVALMRKSGKSAGRR